jgi:hypothetical protein
MNFWQCMNHQVWDHQITNQKNPNFPSGRSRNLGWAGWSRIS